MIKNILLPTDGSDLSRKAEAYGIQLAKSLGARLTALNVTWDYPDVFEERVPVPEAVKKQYYADSAARSKTILEKVSTLARTAGVECEAISAHGDAPHDVIINEAKRHHCDLIVMASHGRKGVAGVLIGSETIKVLTHSKTPVLVVR